MQRSKNWDDRWRCGRERAVTVQLGSSISSEEQNAKEYVPSMPDHAL